MIRCIACEQPDQRIEILSGDPWCHSCIYDGKYAAFVEAQALVSAIVAERGRRVHDLPAQRGSEKAAT